MFRFVQLFKSFSSPNADLIEIDVRCSRYVPLILTMARKKHQFQFTKKTKKLQPRVGGSPRKFTFLEAGRWVHPWEVVSKHCYHTRERKVRLEMWEGHHAAKSEKLLCNFDQLSHSSGERKNGKCHTETTSLSLGMYIPNIALVEYFTYYHYCWWWCHFWVSTTTLLSKVL